MKAATEIVTPRKKRGPPATGKGQPVNVRFKPEVLDQIDALVGKENRAAFVREAISRELSRRERKG